MGCHKLITIQNMRCAIASLIVLVVSAIGLEVGSTQNEKDLTELISLNQGRQAVGGRTELTLSEDDADDESGTDDAEDGSEIAKYMPSFDYVLFGYDIFYGNPSGTSGVDPGLRRAIFRANYSDNKFTSDLRFIEESFIEITGVESYQKWLGTRARVESGIPFLAKFSASTDYKEVEKKTENEGTIYIVVEVIFSVYTADIKPYTYPEFTEDFISDVDTLTEDYDEKIYQDFINNYGTHYITGAQFGARYGQQSSISKESWSEMQSKGINIEAAASFSGKFIRRKALTTDEEQQAMTFMKAIQQQKIYSFGPTPPADNESDTDWMMDEAWMKLVTKDPQPIQIKLSSLDQLNGLKAYLELNNKGKVLDNLKKSLSSYCSRLEKKGIVSSCEAPSKSS